MDVACTDAVRHFNVELCRQLPLDDALFFGMVNGANLLPLDAGDSIRTLATRAQKVDYFLRRVIEPAAKQNLPKLLDVMINSEVPNLKQLADEIQAMLDEEKIQAGTEPGMFYEISIHGYKNFKIFNYGY